MTTTEDVCEVRGVRYQSPMPGTDTLPSGSIDPHTGTRMDLLPGRVLILAGRTFHHGMKYEQDRPDNWKGVPACRHLDHALKHIFNWQSGDRSEDHVGHTVARMLMWADRVLAESEGDIR